MARIRIFHASLNPTFYDTKQLAALTFDEAVKFFEEDGCRACNTGMITINDSIEHELTFHAADDSDTMLNWIKVDCV